MVSFAGLRRVQGHLRGAAVALALVLVTVIDQRADTFNPKIGAIDNGRWWLLGTLLVAGLLIQHRWPVVALSLAGIGAAGHLSYLYVKVRPLDLAVPIILYTLAARARARWISITALGGTLAGMYICSVLQQIELRRPPVTTKAGTVIRSRDADVLSLPDLLVVAFSTAAGVLVLLVAAFALGDAVRSRRAHQRILDEQAAGLLREQQQREALVAAMERARISREMHDVVAHGLSVIVMQAQGGAATLRQHPDRTAEALQNVIVTGRAAMADMRLQLGIDQVNRRLVPQPGVGSLPALVDRVRGAGTPVDLTVDGQSMQLPADVDLTAYRIAQEALTNTIKHAGTGARATVRVAFHPDRLDLEISDDGSGGPTAPTADGRGLRGIADRVAALGGELSLGPGAAGGFRVRVRLPLRPDATTA